MPWVSHQSLFVVGVCCILNCPANEKVFFLKYEVFVEQINLKCDGQEYLDIDQWRLKISAIFQKYYLTSTSQLP